MPCVNFTHMQHSSGCYKLEMSVGEALPHRMHSAQKVGLTPYLHCCIHSSLPEDVQNFMNFTDQTNL